MIKYRRKVGYVNNDKNGYPNTDIYIVEKCLGRRRIVCRGVYRYALPNDYIIQLVDKEGDKVGEAFVASPEEFEKDYEQI